MPTNTTAQITKLMVAANEGDAAAQDKLINIFYDRFKVMAHKKMLRERTGHTWQTLDLVHETVLELKFPTILKKSPNKKYVYKAAANAIRRLLAEHARNRAAAKRGGMMAKVPLDDVIDDLKAQGFDLVEMNDVLELLKTHNERPYEILQLRIVGYGNEEIASIMEVSVKTIERDLRYARSWINVRMKEKRQQ